MCIDIIKLCINKNDTVDIELELNNMRINLCNVEFIQDVKESKVVLKKDNPFCSMFVELEIAEECEDCYVIIDEDFLESLWYIFTNKSDSRRCYRK